MMDLKKIIDIANSSYNSKTIDELPMGGLDARIVNFIQHTAGSLRAPTNFVFGEVLTIIGAIIGRKVTITDGYYRNRTNLFSSVVGVASGSKSPTINHCLKPINKIEKKSFEKFTAAWQAAKSKDEDLPTYDSQIIASNETVENLYRVLNNVKNFGSGLILHQDELLNFFGANAKKYSDGNIIDDFLTLFDGFSPLRVGRVRLEVPIFVPEPFLAILGGIQKKRIDQLFAGQEHNGFFSRWQFWLPNEESPLIDDGDKTPDDEWASLIESSSHAELNNLQLTFDHVEYLRRYDDEYRKLRDELELMEEDELAETIMKQSYIVRRLAGIIHVVNHLQRGYIPGPKISNETVDYAALIIEHLFSNAAIIQRTIAEKTRKKISGREAIVALDSTFGIKNQSMLSAALGGKPSQQYIAKVLAEEKKK